MTRKNHFQQQQLWILPAAPAGVELPATKRRELTAALAELLWQFASVSAERQANQEHGGYDGHDEPDQDHA
jgi:hypothetical protein